jgi:hypothetical protein
MPFVPEVTINGTFGEIYDETGKYLSTVQHIEARVVIEQQEVRPAGQRAVGYKMKGTSGNGTLTQFKVTSDMLTKVSNPMQNPRQRMFVGELLYKLDDPEAIGAEQVRLKRVKFWEIPFGYRINELVEEAITFTFEGIEVVKAISGDPTVVPPVRA